MRPIFIVTLCVGLAACSDPVPKTGALPGVTTGGYAPPSNAEITTSYIAGFQARYDIPELDYPADVKARITKARQERLLRFMKKAEFRQELLAKLALTTLAQTDPEAKEALEKLKDMKGTPPTAKDWSKLMTMIEDKPYTETLTKSEREKIYKSAIQDYKSNFRSLSVENCRWTEMKRLIGTGHEQMAFIHGNHPTHGFKCSVELKTEKRKGYPRLIHFKGFWVKKKSDEWTYFGKFWDVGISPRNLSLNQKLLDDPEKAILGQSLKDMLEN